jgi:RNA polymerase sigma-70 factor, ECF subfamily
MNISKLIANPALRAMNRVTPLTPDEVVREYGDDVWRYVSSKLQRSEDAEDVVMEVFGIACRKIHVLQKTDSPKLWLLAVARKRVMDSLRRKYRRSELPLQSALEHAAPEPSQDRERVQALVNQLPELQQEALILKYVSGLDTVEVARIIRKSPEATNSLLQRAREAIRQKGTEDILN